MLPTPLTARKAQITTDLLGPTSDGPAQNTRSRSSSRATDEASIPGSYQESEADPNEERDLLEPLKTPVQKTRAKGKEKHIPSSSIDLSLHPFYLGSPSTANPIPVVNNLESLIRLLTETTDGPKWYNFVRNMIDYDVSNFNHYSLMEADNTKLRGRVDKHKATIKAYEDRHTMTSNQLLENEERHTSTELQLQHARLIIDELRQDLGKARKELRTREREQSFPADTQTPATSSQAPVTSVTQETGPPDPAETSSAIFQQRHNPKPAAFSAHPLGGVTIPQTEYPKQVKWRAQGIDPAEKLTGTDKRAHGPWAYSVKGKFRTDAPLYPTESHKIDYMINQMKEPIFHFMISWAETNETGTSKELFTEIEHYMGIHNQESDARKLLYEMTMGEKETVDELYHKMFHLWNLAKIPEKERIDQFITSLRPHLSTSITNMRFISVREAVDEVRLTETRKRIINDKYAKTNPKTNNNSNNNLKNSQPSLNKNNNKQKSSGPAMDNANEKFIPCTKKPTGWVGVWYEPEQYPKKLEQNEKWELTRQGRCWKCRGSGHKAGDEKDGKTFCPSRKEKKVNVQKVEEVESSFEEEKA